MALNWETKEYGKLCYTTMSTAPYPHESRNDGYQRGDVIYSAAEHYSNNTVALVLPNHYRPTPQLHILLHFHGHYAEITNVVTHFELADQLSQSGKNAILVIPQGPVNVPDSTFGKLDQPDGFKNFLNELLPLLQADMNINPAGKTLRVKEIILMGHSGGYYTIGQILKQGGVTPLIKEVYLLDATYGQLETYTDWCQRAKGRLISTFTEHLGWNNTVLMSLMRAKNIPLNILPEKETTAAQMQKSRILFLPTENNHDDVPMKTRLVERLLKTSGLPDK